MTEKEILLAAINKYGVVSQLDMACEESAEMIQAINKVKRNCKLFHYVVCEPNEQDTVKYSTTYFNLCGEIADVKIMIKQLELMFSQEAIDLAYERKLARLEERINKS